MSHLIILDAVPILEALERCDARFAQAWWHWFFFAQPDKPERAILQDPEAWYHRNSPDTMGVENYADYREAIHDPQTVHGMIEDYRAGLGIDREHDEADRCAGRRVECPLLAMWALKDDLEELYGDVLAIWRAWGRDVHGHGLESGHHMAEEIPELLSEAIGTFINRPSQSFNRGTT